MDYIEWYNKTENIVFNIISTLSKMKIEDKSAIIFDIDDTLIHSNGHRIDIMFFLFNYIKFLGIYIVIITSRIGSPENIEATLQQLKFHGIQEVECIYFRNPFKFDCPFQFKEICRKSVYDTKGLTVIMSIGDQPWDIGNYGGIGYLIPVYNQNYFK